MAAAAALARLEQKPKPRLPSSHDVIKNQGKNSQHPFLVQVHDRRISVYKVPIQSIFTSLFIGLAKPTLNSVAFVSQMGGGGVHLGVLVRLT